MFCPICKVEYRQGFTRCSDCDVELVAALDEAPDPRDGPVTPENPLVRIPQSADGGLRDLACEILDQAGIPYEAPEVNAPLLFSSMRSPSYLLWVCQSDLDAAKRALQQVVARPSTRQYAFLEDALGLTQTDEEPAEAENENEGDTPLQPVRWTDFMGMKTEDKGPEAIPENWDPETAVTEIWSGTDSDMEETLVMCLRENGIPCRALEEEGAKRRLLVRREDEDRAREILRAIVEAAPPE